MRWVSRVTGLGTDVIRDWRIEATRRARRLPYNEFWCFVCPTIETHATMPPDPIDRSVMMLGLSGPETHYYGMLNPLIRTIAV